ncbi:MAG TPA: VOC family protein [Chloroflexota bacterium]|nr:VOC family protein [Chloroflexota bacterium]
MAAVSQLGYVGIGVSDAGGWKKLATEIYGMEIVPGDDSRTTYLRMDDQPHRIQIQENGRDDIEFLGWQVPDSAAFHAVAQQLEGGGVKVTAGTQGEADERRVVELFRCEDPNGVRTEVFYGRPVNQRPFRPSRAISGFKTGALGLGHALMFTTELDRSVAFYRDLLGFRISDYVNLKTPDGRIRAAFLHCNPRHHSIAFIEAPAPKKINHLMFEAEDLDDVGSGRDLAQQQGVPVIIDLGRHMNDRVVSFYMGNPSQWALEYGWGGRLIDDATWQVEQYTAIDSLWGHPQLINLIPHD